MLLYLTWLLYVQLLTILASLFCNSSKLRRCITASRRFVLGSTLCNISIPILSINFPFHCHRLLHLLMHLLIRMSQIPLRLNHIPHQLLQNLRLYNQPSHPPNERSNQETLPSPSYPISPPHLPPTSRA